MCKILQKRTKFPENCCCKPAPGLAQTDSVQLLRRGLRTACNADSSDPGYTWPELIDNEKLKKTSLLGILTRWGFPPWIGPRLLSCLGHFFWLVLYYFTMYSHWLSQAKMRANMSTLMLSNLTWSLQRNSATTRWAWGHDLRDHDPCLVLYRRSVLFSWTLCTCCLMSQDMAFH